MRGKSVKRQGTVGAILLFFLLLPLAGSATVGAKQVLLTFDDGPDPRYTAEILDILQEHKIKGLFFVLGKQVEENPWLLDRLLAEGHTIGNHTYDHRGIKKMTAKGLETEVAATDSLIEKAGGPAAVYFRPPLRGLE